MFEVGMFFVSLNIQALNNNFIGELEIPQFITSEDESVLSIRLLIVKKQPTGTIRN